MTLPKPWFPAILGAALLALVLAGCISQTENVQPTDLPLGNALGLYPAPSLRCVGELCNLLATIEPARQGNEVTIAVNPLDPQNVVAGAKDYFPPSAGECVWDGIYATHDGATFESKSLPGSPWLLVNDPASFEPTPISQYWCATDPVVAFGPDGTLYYSLLAYQGDPVTGSKAGREVTCALHEISDEVPCSGVNDFAFNRVSIAVAISHDGGRTIDEYSIVDSGSFPVNFHDRQWIEVDQANGNVYLAWTTILVPGNSFYKSTDGGRTWSLPVLLDDPPIAGGVPGMENPGGMFVAVGADGAVYVTGCSSEGPMVTVSTDEGESFSGWSLVAASADQGMEAEYRSGQVCMVAADDTAGPYAGRVYLAWSATTNGNRDVFFAASDDRGATWTEPVRLNTDATENDQFFPAISVSPKGVVDVAWYDRRNDPENRLLDVYHTYSRDGGATWSDDFRVTEASSDPAHSLHQGGFVFIGDYIDIDSSDDCAWPVWVDTRNEKADVMTACVLRPGTPLE